MAWLIQHKCNDLDGVQDYGMIRGTLQGGPSPQPITQAKCTKCGEEIVFLGDDLFDEAQAMMTPSHPDLPPGFFIPRSAKA